MSYAKKAVTNLKKTGAPKSKAKKSKRIPYARMVKQVYGDVMPFIKMAKGVLNTENKYIDTAIATSVSSSISTTYLNLMAQGNTASTRLGDTVKFDFLHYHLVITISAAATVSTLRIFILRDQESNGTNFSYSGSANSYANAGTPYAMTNFQVEQRYYTYLDELVVVDSAGPQGLVLRGSKRLGTHTNYGLGNAGTQADISNNTFILAMISNESTNNVNVNGYFRMLFVDN